MSQINFLPTTFRKAQRRQKRRSAEFAIIGVTAVAMIGLWLYAGGPDTTLAQQSEKIDAKIETIQEQHDEQTELQKQRTLLQRKLQIARETSQPITATMVLARLSQLAPESIHLINIEIATTRPEPEKIAAAETKKTKRKRVGDKKAEEPTMPSVMRVAIIGHAPSDDEIVTLLRRLNDDPVFTSAALRGSRMSRTDTHFVRAFQLDVVIDLDRRFVPAPVNGGSE